jgi:hypothetical protein
LAEGERDAEPEGGGINTTVSVFGEALRPLLQSDALGDKLDEAFSTL